MRTVKCCMPDELRSSFICMLILNIVVFQYVQTWHVLLTLFGSVLPHVFSSSGGSALNTVL